VRLCRIGMVSFQPYIPKSWSLFIHPCRRKDTCSRVEPLQTVQRALSYSTTMLQHCSKLLPYIARIILILEYDSRFPSKIAPFGVPQYSSEACLRGCVLCWVLSIVTCIVNNRPVSLAEIPACGEAHDLVRMSL
jgi:hypothetical protein